MNSPPLPSNVVPAQGPMAIPVIPENAPFSPDQRAWLNGFFAGIFSRGAAPASAPTPPVAVEEENFPWHDPALPLPERLALAEGKPLSRRLMAAMAQLDCGSCGSNCQQYAESIAKGEDSDLTKCSPGGRDTSRKLKELVATDLTIGLAPPPPKPAPTTKDGHRKPVPAHFLSATRLTGETSGKDVRHIVIDLSASSLTYEVGDSLGVVPQNCPDLVAHLITLLGALGNESIATPSDGFKPLAEALRSSYAITAPSDDLLELLASVATSPEEAADIRKHLEGDGYPEGVQIADLLAKYPSAKPSLEAFLKALKPLQPRLYSISSSLKSSPNQVHLTVGVVKYTNAHQRDCKGVASTFLGERIEPGSEVKVYVHESKTFRLPTDPQTPVIMIGPGTGIAPFRAFLHEREATKAPGKSWLFFGDQKQATDFLYRTELESFLSSGTLTRLSVAFSRDQKEKIYVQTRMQEHAAELYQWLEAGAHVYVCGDAKRMAKDVDDTLNLILQQQGNLTKEAATAYLNALKQKNRYQRDVY